MRRVAKTILCFVMVSLSVPPLLYGGETETKRQYEHRQSRIRYLSMRQQRYQNVVDTNIFKLAELYLEDQEFEKAVGVLKTVARKSPDEKSRWTAHYVIGDIYWIEFDDALTAAQEFEQVKGTLEPICFTNLMGIYGQLGKKQESRNFALQRLNVLEQKAVKVKSRHDREQYLAKITFSKVGIFTSFGEKEKAIAACKNLDASVKNQSIRYRAKSMIQQLQR